MPDLAPATRNCRSPCVISIGELEKSKSGPSGLGQLPVACPLHSRIQASFLATWRVQTRLPASRLRASTALGESLTTLLSESPVPREMRACFGSMVGAENTGPPAGPES